MAVQSLPQTAIERRLSLRLLAYWEKLRKGRQMPSERDIVSEDIGDLWQNCFLIHVKGTQSADYQYSHLGRHVVEIYHGSSSEGALESVVTPAGMMDGYKTVIATGKPLMEEGEFRRHSNQRVKYRQCLLPLGEGNNVQAILGSLSAKVFPG